MCITDLWHGVLEGQKLGSEQFKTHSIVSHSLGVGGILGDHVLPNVHRLAINSSALRGPTNPSRMDWTVKIGMNSVRLTRSTGIIYADCR